MPQFFLFCQSLASVLPQPFNLPLMFRLIGVKELDIVCLVSPFLIGPCKLTQQHILLLNGVHFGDFSVHFMENIHKCLQIHVKLYKSYR